MLVPVWILRRLFFGDAMWAITGDSPQLYYPDFVFLNDAIFGGTFPLWDPYERLGDPFLTDPQSGLFYPVNYVFLLLGRFLGDVPSYALFEAKTVFHISLGALGFFVFTRRALELPRLASMAGAIVFVTGPYFVSHLAHCLLWPYVYAPWILFLLHRLAATNDASRRRLVGALALAVGLVLTAQSPPSAYYVLVTASFYALFLSLRLAFERDEDRAYAFARAGRYVAWCFVALGLGLLMASVVIVPAALHLDFSALAERTFAYVSGGAVGGDPWDKLLRASTKLHEEKWVYAGGVVVAATLLSPLLAHRRRLFAIFWVAMALFFFTLVTTDSTTLKLWFKIAPGGDLFRIPARYISIVQIAASVACALSFAGIQEGAAHLAKRFAPASAGEGPSPHAFIASAVAAALVVVPTLYVLQDQAKHYGLHRVSKLKRPLFHRDSLAEDVVVSGASKRDYRVVNDGYLYVGSGDRFRFRDARGYNHNFVNRRHRAFLRALRPGGKTNLLRLVGAKVYAQHPKNLLAAVHRAHLRPEFVEVKPRLLHLSGPVMPPAFVVDTVRVTDTATAWKDVKKRQDYRNYAVLEEGHGLDVSRLRRRLKASKTARAVDFVKDPADKSAVAPGYAPARLSELSYHRAVVDVESNGGLLVYNALYYPGWVAYVDGVKQPVVRANYLQMATLVPAGHHRVVFAFETDWLKFPLYFALLALFASIALIVGGMELSRQQEESAQDWGER